MQLYFSERDYHFKKHFSLKSSDEDKKTRFITRKMLLL
jgi:hypothetical protein